VTLLAGCLVLVLLVVSMPGGLQGSVAAAQGTLEDTMSVRSINLRYLDLGDGRYKVQGKVLIIDQGQQRLGGAMVTATWTAPNGKPNTRAKPTNAAGWAKFSVTTRLEGTFTLCVDDVVLAGYTYVPGDNRETCDTIDVP
jgi:hypothetical protein